MRQLLINMPSMKKKVICITAWIYDLSALTLLQFFSFQYYEMSYGLNVEMHKQVRRLLLQKPFSLHCYFNIYRHSVWNLQGFWICWMRLFQCFSNNVNTNYFYWFGVHFLIAISWFFVFYYQKLGSWILLLWDIIPSTLFVFIIMKGSHKSTMRMEGAW